MLFATDLVGLFDVWCEEVSRPGSKDTEALFGVEASHVCLERVRYQTTGVSK